MKDLSYTSLSASAIGCVFSMLKEFVDYTEIDVRLNVI